ncbi:MAG: hypothetical protein EGR71_06285 [Clostridiales bacterium]|nr:hypothetical protein [Clostridiales bacterium]
MIVGNRRKSGINLLQIWNVAKVEYAKWICNPRMIIILCMVLFVYDYIVCTMHNASGEMGKMCMIIEPFLAICNSTLLILIMPIVFLTLMGDFPKTDGNTMFYIYRTGKKNWLIGQVIFAAMADATFIFIVFICAVISSLTFSRNMVTWSDVVTKYIYTFPDRYGSLMASLLTNRLYNNLSPYQALFYSLTLMFLYLLLLAVILLTAFSIGKRIIGMAINVLIMCIGSAMIYMNGMLKWIFPAANATCWVHYDKIMKKQIFSIKYSYLYFYVLILVFIIIDILTIGHYDFAKITDMED